MINIQGPKSRQLLNQITSADLSNEAFPYMSAQEIEFAYARPLALRVTYEGELGWELHVPTEFSVHVYEELVAAGADFRLKHAGFQALNTLRIEKAYREYAHDMDNTHTPLEAGLEQFVKYDKPGGFIGRDALLHHKEKGVLRECLVQFLLEDPEPLLHGSEVIYRDGKSVGYLQTGGYGFTLGGAVGLGFVENEAGVSADFINSGTYEIDIAGERYPARASLRPMYDPKNERPRS
jgi:4-methylaminobutanoate oxidase (formaldehyde-forming)